VLIIKVKSITPEGGTLICKVKSITPEGGTLFCKDILKG